MAGMGKWKTNIGIFREDMKIRSQLEGMRKCQKNINVELKGVSRCGMN
jgi:hypothetical protein